MKIIFFALSLLLLSCPATAVVNTPPVIRCTGQNYLTCGSGQNIVVSQIDLASNVLGNLPPSKLNSGIGADTTTFWRGDGVWAVPAVSSVFGRTGSVTAQSGDYTTSLVAEGSNLYFTNARADARISAQAAQPNGLATLDGGGLVPSSQIPPLAITETYVVSSQAAMLALPATVGDVAIRTDITESFILQSNPAATLSNWVQILTPAAPVQSVNGFTGTVSLTTSNIMEGSNLYFTSARSQAAISASAPLTYTSGVLAIPLATSSADGYLSSTDWSSFSAKQPSGSYLTAITGDVAAAGPGSAVAAIQSNAVSNSKLAQMSANTIKGNNTGSLANAVDLSTSQVTAMLNPFIGDSGSGGTQGLVPAPGAGAYAAGNFLSAGGTFSYVDQSKPIYQSFAAVNQTSNPASLAKINNVAVYTGITGKQYAVTIGAVASTIAIYDVTDEAAPVLLSSMSNLAGAYNISIVTVSGSVYAFVGSSGSTHLYIVNITNPYSPSITTNYTLTGSPGALYGIAYYNGYAYIATQSLGLTVIDVGGGGCSGTLTSPAQCYQEGSSSKSFGVAVSNGTLYTTQYVTSGFSTRQIKSWSISTPQTPSLLQSLQVTSVGEALGITISGNTAFVTVIATGVNAVDLIDITTPSSMSNLSQITATNTFNSAMVGVASGNYLFIPSGSNATYGGSVDFYDITTRTAPLKISTVTSGTANSVFGGIALANGYIYAGDYGIAPGSTGALDIFTMPLLTPIAGVLTGAGVLAGSFTSNSANPATTGLVRLGTADTITWRNLANSANVTLSKDSSDNLNWPNSFSAGSTSYIAAGQLKSNGSAPSAAVQVAAGSTATCTLSHSTDMAGSIAIANAGSGITTGDQCDLTFNTAYAVAPICILSVGDSGTAAGGLQIYPTASATKLSVNFGVAGTTGHTYTILYHCTETQ